MKTCPDCTTELIESARLHDIWTGAEAYDCPGCGRHFHVNYLRDERLEEATLCAEG